MTIPTHHTIGDTGHVNDHNLIVDAITALQTQITSLTTSGLPAGAVYVYVGVTDPNATVPYLWLDTSQSPPALNYVYTSTPINLGKLAAGFAGAAFASFTY